MRYFGVFHADYSRSHAGIFDAPCITKGRMTLCAREAASDGGVIALAEGRVRGLARLNAALGCPRDGDASRAVLAAYRRWGEDYPRHIEGPVVTCVMDSNADALVLSRDRMGERPVFYAPRGDSCAFSDHPDTLLKTASAEPVMDGDGLRELFGLGPARTPGRTFLRDIMALEPGCALVIRGSARRVDRYFALQYAPHEEDETQTIDHTRALLNQAVDEIAPLRPAVMLSGGLDSTALTALLARRGGGIMSFSVDYPGNAGDFQANAFRPEMDAPYIDMAVRAFHTQHRTVMLEPEALAGALGRAMSLRGFSGLADIDASLLLFAGQIARYADDVVSGECGDEVFGGYPWFRGEAPLGGGAFPWSGSMALREGVLNAPAREKLKLAEYVRDVFDAHVAAAEPACDCAPRERRLRIMQKLCFEYFMANLQERALAMCEGAGVRVLTPLCDDRLAAYVFNVPWEMKFMGGQEKGLFRAAVADLLPEGLLRRTKSPYPKTCAPRFAEIMRGMARSMIDERDAPIFEWVDRDAVRRVALSGLDAAEAPWYGQLMAGPQLLGYLWQINRWMKERGIRAEV